MESGYWWCSGSVRCLEYEIMQENIWTPSENGWTRMQLDNNNILSNSTQFINETRLKENLNSKFIQELQNVEKKPQILDKWIRPIYELQGSHHLLGIHELQPSSSNA